MLRLDRINGNQIAGLSTEEMDFIDNLLCEHYEDDTIFNQFTGMPSNEHFELPSADVDLTSDQLGEIASIEKEAKSKHTENQTKHYMKMLTDFLKENKLPTSMIHIESYLRLFFAKIKKKSGESYSTTSLVCMRAAFHRYFLETRNIPLIGNENLQSLEKTFKAALAAAMKTRPKSLAEGGSGYPPIEPGDLAKLQIYFDRRSPVALQDEIFFSIVYYFGFRGREWIRSLDRSSVLIKTNGSGAKYVDICKPVYEKNVRIGHELSVRQTLMAENSNDSSKCPVAAMEIYLSKLPGDNLFPKPKACYQNGDWYCVKSNLGKNTLQDMMKNMSSRANLNQRYTNHSIRATVVTSLRRQGFTEEQCMRVTGQKRKESVQLYDKRRLSEKTTYEEKKNVSNALTSSLAGDVPCSSDCSNTITTRRMIVEQVSTDSGCCNNSLTLSAPAEKKMKVVADGSRNVVTISFE